MLRITEIKLPLDHAEEALKAALLKKLGIPADELLELFTAQRPADES